MAKKIRIHELAKELGMSNPDCLKLCDDLGIGATSHSSSIDDPQADRVRRKAKKDGLSKAPKIEKPKATKASTAPTKASTKPAATKTEPAKKEPAKKEPADKKPVTAVSTKTASTKKTPAKTVSTKTAPTKASTKPAATKTEPAKKEPAEQPTAQPTPQPADPEKPVSRTLLSRSGKPIPPPPKPRGAPGGVITPRRIPRRGHSKPDVVLPSTNRIGQAPPEKRDGKTGQRPPQPFQQPRRHRGGRRRRRAPIEELQPVGEQAYTPIDAPVPEGTILVERGSTSQDFAAQLNRKAADLIKYFLDHGESITAMTQLTDEMIELYSMEINADVQLINPGEEVEKELQKLLEIPENPPDQLISRGPVVTVMGHVDHGKTKLLDRIRNADVVSGEKGGITQHIGAYQTLHNDKPITFIDTPGHEAFTAMRARGARATDIVVLVVAANDGVMPQTVEAINHAKAAEVPILIAINKVDLDSKDIPRTLQQVAEQELVPESYGGDVLVAEVSATEGTGIDDLLDKILLLAELEELKAREKGRAVGLVLESKMSPGQGTVATLLINHGRLSIGDPIAAGSAWGKVRALLNDKGEKIKQAGPTTPVQVLGLSGSPNAGAEFVCAPNESIASKVAERRLEIERGTNLSRSSSVTSNGASLDDIFSEISAGQVVTLNLIVKADTFGSLEAVTDRLLAITRENLKISYIHKGVGGISGNDIQLAAASNATIIGFNIRPEKKLRDMATAESVDIRTYEVIYSLVEDVEAALRGMLEPEYEEIITGEAEVKEVFHIKGIGYVAGCYVRSGKIAQGSGVRFLRDGTIIWKGDLKSLKRHQDNVKEVSMGNECGIGLSDFQDLKQNDVIETYENKEIELFV